jgi:hypothetical protein
MQIAAILLSLGALGGLTLAGVRIATGKNPTTWIALGHGAVVATGLGFFIYAATVSSLSQFAQFALGIFGLAALGGITLFAGFHSRSRLLPIPLVLGHGLIAIVGVVLLWLSVAGRG